MDVRIGIQNIAREVVVESDQTPEAIEEIVAKAFADGGLLKLNDAKGRQVLVPVNTIGYVEVGTVTPPLVKYLAFHANCGEHFAVDSIKDAHRTVCGGGIDQHFDLRLRLGSNQLFELTLHLRLRSCGYRRRHRA